MTDLPERGKRLSYLSEAEASLMEERGVADFHHFPVIFTCQRCGYRWSPRANRVSHKVLVPLRCPNRKCNSRKWMIKSEEASA